MAATVHGFHFARPLAALQQSTWFAAMAARLTKAGAWLWQECQQAGERRARSHLIWLADCHEGSNPELARQLRNAIR
jgi:hypothetical protein